MHLQFLHRFSCFSFVFLYQPLKDIAVLGGITARFECIVQCDPYPYVEWYKSDTDEPLRSGYGKYYIEFRNGVCRLTIPDAISSKLDTSRPRPISHLQPDQPRLKIIHISTLIIGDAGTYMCTATNHLGSVATQAELVVNTDYWNFRK